MASDMLEMMHYVLEEAEEFDERGKSQDDKKTKVYRKWLKESPLRFMERMSELEKKREPEKVEEKEVDEGTKEAVELYERLLKEWGEA